MGDAVTAPDLKLLPGQNAIEQDEIGVNPSTCESLWQIGVPEVTSPVDAPGIASTIEPVLGSPSSASATTSTLYTGSGYEKAWLTDVVDYTVTYDETDLSWAYDFTCVRSSSAAVRRGWSAGSGWQPPYNTSQGYLASGCGYHEAQSSADFKNTGFCWPNTVYSKYHTIWIRAWFDSTLEGGYGTRSHSGNSGCAPLYDHNKLVRST